MSSYSTYSADLLGRISALQQFALESHDRAGWPLDTAPRLALSPLPDPDTNGLGDDCWQLLALSRTGTEVITTLAPGIAQSQFGPDRLTLAVSQWLKGRLLGGTDVTYGTQPWSWDGGTRDAVTLDGTATKASALRPDFS
jgi:hypothetical protein